MRKRASTVTRVVCSLLLVSVTACSATVHRVNGPNVAAEIVGSDRDGLEVTSDQGATYRLPRDSVASIDHPGGVAAILGAVAFVAGGLVAVTAGGRREAFIPGLVVSTAGFVALLGGLIPYSRSRNAAHAFLEAPPGQHTMPADTRWGVPQPPPRPAIAQPQPAVPDPEPLTEALLPMPAWTDDPELAILPPASLPPPPPVKPAPASPPPAAESPPPAAPARKSRASKPAPVTKAPAPAAPEPTPPPSPPQPRPIFKPAPPATPN